MRIRKVDLIHVLLPMKEPFVAGCGPVRERHVVITKVHTDRGVGIGEVSSLHGPDYSYETTGTALHILQQWIVPRLLGKDFDEPADLVAAMEDIRGHNMAKSGVETAFWDLYSREKGRPIAELLGGVRKAVPSGVSIGMKDTVEQVVTDAEAFLDVGYRRLKIKVKPGKDVQVIRALRERFPDVMMMADANSSYRLNRPEDLKALKATGPVRPHHDRAAAPGR